MEKVEHEICGVWTRGADPKELVLSDGSRLLLESGMASDGEVEHLHRGGPRRKPWHLVACCPPNVMRLLASLGHEVTAAGVARLYEGLLDRYVLDEADAELAPALEALGMVAVAAQTVMQSDADRASLARFLLESVAR